EGAPERRPASTAPAPAMPEPLADPSKSGRHKTSSLVFLDVDEPPAPKGGYTARTVPPPKPPPVAEPEPEPELEPEPVEGLIEPVAAEPDPSLDIESTSLVEGLEPTVPSDPLEGFETTSAEVRAARRRAGEGEAGGAEAAGGAAAGRQAGGRGPAARAGAGF